MNIVELDVDDTTGTILSPWGVISDSGAAVSVSPWLVGVLLRNHLPVCSRGVREYGGGGIARITRGGCMVIDFEDGRRVEYELHPATLDGLHLYIGEQR